MTTITSRDWLWPHAHRFTNLDLVLPSEALDHISKHIGDRLEALSSCFMALQWALSASHVMPITLNMTMPNLRELTLM